MSSWRSQEWEAYSGPLCDDPAERRGLPDGLPALDDRPDPAELVDVDEPEPEWDWSDLSPAERAIAKLRSLR